MSAVQQLRQQYDQAVEAERQATAHRIACREAMQGWCEHPVDRIVEAPGYEGIAVDFPPFRVCRDCGLHEEGYHYTKLAPGNYSIPQMSRDEAQELVIR